MNRTARILGPEPPDRLSRQTSRGVLSFDVPEGAGAGPAALSLPSEDLLDRALVGWERFLCGFFSEVSDE